MPRRPAARQEDREVGREAGWRVDVEEDELRDDDAGRHDPDDDDGEAGSRRRAVEAQRVADGVPALHRDTHEREDRHRDGDSLQQMVQMSEEEQEKGCHTARCKCEEKSEKRRIGFVSGEW